MARESDSYQVSQICDLEQTKLALHNESEVPQIL